MPFTFSADALVTSEEVSNYLYSVDDATTLDAVTAAVKLNIELNVNAATSQILKYIGYKIREATYTEAWDGNGSDEMIPRQFPITGVTSVKVSGNGDFASADPISTSLIFWDDVSIRFRDMRTPKGRGVIQIVYTAGYDEIPPDLVLASILQIQFLNKKTGQGGFMSGISSISKGVGGGNETQTKDKEIAVKGGLIMEVAAMLDAYQRFEVPNSIMYARTS